MNIWCILSTQNLREVMEYIADIVRRENLRLADQPMTSNSLDQRLNQKELCSFCYNILQTHASLLNILQKPEQTRFNLPSANERFSCCISASVKFLPILAYMRFRLFTPIVLSFLSGSIIMAVCCSSASCRIAIHTEIQRIAENL